jgi:hypothetical protein
LTFQSGAAFLSIFSKSSFAIISGLKVVILYLKLK